MDACLAAEFINDVANHAPVHRIKIEMFLLEFMNGFCEPNKSFFDGLQIHAGSGIKQLSVLINDKVDSNLLDLVFELESKSLRQFASINKLCLAQ